MRTRQRFLREVEAFEQPHRSGFATQRGVAEGQAVVWEYLGVGL